MDNVARTIGMDVEQFKEVNFYKKGDVSFIVIPLSISIDFFTYSI